jgi:ABC-type branched-subunit amino acid transport system permease subunit
VLGALVVVLALFLPEGVLGRLRRARRLGRA